MVYSSVFGNKNAYFGNIVYGLNQEENSSPNESCTLFISGFESASGNTPLYIRGVIPSSGGCDLYINGEQTTFGITPLYISGSGYATPTSSMNLFIGATYEGVGSGSVPLSIYGTETGNQSITGLTPLYIEGFTLQSSGNMNLLIQGVGDTSSNLNLSLWNETPNINGSITLAVNNNYVGEGLGLYTIAGGFINPTANIDPLVQGSGYGSLNLYIGRNDAGEVIPLFLKATELSTNEDLPLYMQGGVPISSGVDLYTKGFITPSGILPVYIKGY